MFGCLASEANLAAREQKRYQEIVQRKNLKEFAQAQGEELAFLWAEVERLRMKSFPSLDQLKHNWAEPSLSQIIILFTLLLAT